MSFVNTTAEHFFLETEMYPRASLKMKFETSHVSYSHKPVISPDVQCGAFHMVSEAFLPKDVHI